MKPLKIGLISLFPKAFEFLEDKEKSGLVGKAFSESRVELFKADLRDFGEGRHKVVDDMPFGGGDGMVLKPAPLKAAIEALIESMACSPHKVKVVFMTPVGDLWTQAKAEQFSEHMVSSEEALVLVCGRYAGFDQRVIDYFGGNEVSIGPFILNGGELAALCVIESLVRLLPGVLGNSDSALVDSFSKGTAGLLEPPSYTRPQEWEGLQVPEILTSGDHKAVEAYRNEASLARTKAWLSKVKKAVFSSENGF